MDGDAARAAPAAGWPITGGLVSAVGASADEPPAAAERDRRHRLPGHAGLINTHHHLYQNLTRAYPPMTDKPLFGWLQSLYPLWRGIDEEAAARVGVGRSGRAGAVGCTTSTDHLYLHPRGAGDLLGGRDRRRPRPRHALPPDARLDVAVARRTAACRPTTWSPTTTTILAACEAAVARHHDRAHGAMVRIALAPCSPFSVTEELMVRSAELAERLDVRLHTHFAENAEDDEFSLATFGCRPMEYLERTGWCTDRTWVAHCVMPDADEVAASARPASAWPTARAAT